MASQIDAKTRAALIRKGNEHFNKGEMQAAFKIFNTIDHKTGLEQIGDHYFYNERLPLVALKYYFLVKNDRAEDKINEIFERMVFAFKKLLRDENANDTDAPASEKDGGAASDTPPKGNITTTKKWAKPHFFITNKPY